MFSCQRWCLERVITGGVNLLNYTHTHTPVTPTLNENYSRVKRTTQSPYHHSIPPHHFPKPLSPPHHPHHSIPPHHSPKTTLTTIHPFSTIRYNIVFFTTTYVLPMLVMLVSYTLISCELWGSHSIGELTDRQVSSIKSKRRVSLGSSGAHTSLPVVVPVDCCVYQLSLL